MLKSEVIYALKQLNENGYEAYIVGGAVRDYLLNKAINDYDITTNALPEEIEQVFSAFPLYSCNKRFGTITVTINHCPLEITTYRSDETYQDHRKPSSLNFVKDIETDVFRRDFTINCLLCDANLNIIDLVNGQKDLENHIIRAVGEAEKRFSEDALRILRAIRFKAQLNFDIEKTTNDAIFKKAELLDYISIERKRDELYKILASNHRQVLSEYQTIINRFFEYTSINPLIFKTDNLLLKLYLLNPNFNFKLLKLSNNDLKQLHEYSNYAKYKNLNELLANIQFLDNFFEYMLLTKGEDLRPYYHNHQAYIVNIKQLAINGADLKALGYEKQMIGYKLKEVLTLIHQEKLNNQHQEIINYLKTN